MKEYIRCTIYKRDTFKTLLVCPSGWEVSSWGISLKNEDCPRSTALQDIQQQTINSMSLNIFKRIMLLLWKWGTPTPYHLGSFQCYESKQSSDNEEWRSSNRYFGSISLKELSKVSVLSPNVQRFNACINLRVISLLNLKNPKPKEISNVCCWRSNNTAMY